jgi:aspartyl/asparaginyl beta-hydroxylase (cupin superfamily)/Flp pilus assembly protein TadD
MNATVDDARIVALVAAVEKAYASGSKEAAAKALEVARAAAPRHPQVLHALAVHALNGGDAARARALLEAATAIDPTRPAYWQNMALACNLLGDSDAELEALDKTIALEPYSFLAVLQKGALLERRGQARKAATVYHGAIAMAPPEARLSPQVRGAVEHARRFVQADKVALESFLQTHLSAAAARHSGARLERFERCLDVLLGRRRIYVQQPTFMNFPFLPAIQFYDRPDFGWLDAIEAATPDIRNELLRVMAEEQDEFVPYVANPAGVPLNQWQELNHSLRWSVFYLWHNGVPREAHLARCPVTAAALAAAPLLDVPGRAPTAFFSLLRPKTRIPPHTGVSNTRLTVHLPLVVPEGCRFRVGSETREWREGHAWVFDDTIEHEAWNDSDHARAIMIFDCWNPYLTEAEKDMVRAVMQGIGEFYQADSPLAASL